MRISFSSVLATFVIASAAACYSSVCSIASYAWGRIGGFFRDAVATFEKPTLQLIARPVELVQACAYALKLAKRERPHVEQGSWRMCPSV